MTGARRTLLVAMLGVMLAAPAAAWAHGSSSYVASVRRVVPRLRGARVRVDRGFRLVLTYRGRTPLVVLDPNGKPYLRFTRAGVAANIGGWTPITSKRTFAWPVPEAAAPRVAPLVVRTDPGKPHHLRGWSVRMRVGGRPYAIVGSLDYRVSGEGLDELLFPFAPVPLLLLLAAGIVRRSRA
jgi:hypothetical protein